MANLAILGISLLTSFILALSVLSVAKLVISGAVSSICFVLALYTTFLAASYFTTLLRLLQSTGTLLVYQYLIYLLYFLNCLNLLVHFSTYQYLIYLY